MTEKWAVTIYERVAWGLKLNVAPEEVTEDSEDV